jgi:hypothetical protein
MSKKIISYSLYGSKSYYCEGAIKNAKDKTTTYGSEWETWFYVYEDVPQNYIEELKKHADKIIYIDKNFYIKHGMFWRFLPILENDVICMIVRDLDSRSSQKEVICVNEWIESDKAVHIIRDGITHQMPFMGGILGFKKPLPFNLNELINKYPQFWTNNQYNMDQLFLAHCVYPLTINNRLIHDSFNHYELDGYIKLETTERFIGEKILEDGTPDGYKELYDMSNKYIYFYRNIDLYNTEQFGAFLYEFMENLQIARKMGRTLVIPNVFISPRNNEKILSEKHIYLKSLSIVPITNYLNLSEIDMRFVKLLPLSEFYEKTYINPAAVLYNSSRLKIDEYIQNNYLATPFGKMNINKKININTFGLNTLQILSTDIYKDLDTFQNIIILDNGRLGQPNWHSESIGLDYFLIRMGLLYNTRLQDIANIYINYNQIRIKSTLMVHWRNGDYILSGKNTNKYEKYEDETNIYFQNYIKMTNPLNILANILEIKQQNMEITQVFLVTNNINLNEINLLNNELKQFNINVIQYVNENEQDEGMIQQLIGAQCKYHLHGPTQYERMSAFGRWMIEERKRYYFNDKYITTMDVFNHIYFMKKIL